MMEMRYLVFRMVIFCCFCNASGAPFKPSVAAEMGEKNVAPKDESVNKSEIVPSRMKDDSLRQSKSQNDVAADKTKIASLYSSKNNASSKSNNSLAQSLKKTAINENETKAIDAPVSPVQADSLQKIVSTDEDANVQVVARFLDSNDQKKYSDNRVFVMKASERVKVLEQEKEAAKIVDAERDEYIKNMREDIKKKDKDSFFIAKTEESIKKLEEEQEAARVVSADRDVYIQKLNDDIQKKTEENKVLVDVANSKKDVIEGRIISLFSDKTDQQKYNDNLASIQRLSKLEQEKEAAKIVDANRDEYIQKLNAALQQKKYDPEKMAADIKTLEEEKAAAKIADADRDESITKLSVDIQQKRDENDALVAAATTKKDAEGRLLSLFSDQKDQQKYKDNFSFVVKASDSVKKLEKVKAGDGQVDPDRDQYIKKLNDDIQHKSDENKAIVAAADEQKNAEARVLTVFSGKEDQKKYKDNFSFIIKASDSVRELEKAKTNDGQVDPDRDQYIKKLNDDIQQKSEENKTLVATARGKEEKHAQAKALLSQKNPRASQRQH